MTAAPTKTLNLIRILPGLRPTERCYGVSREVSPRRSGSNTYMTAPFPLETLQKGDKYIQRHHGYRYTSPSLPAATALVLIDLFELRQILTIEVLPYELRITIGAIFDWEDIEDQILTILRRCYFEGDDYNNVVLQDRTNRDGLTGSNSAERRDRKPL